ncbi:unnamed protein product [Ranitomeya imitator]|uniref:Helix-turn-helix domain-containing protein n=1 Tax=Ranitomeya imitator TaxID=111125 RepID=A0ABN9KYP6_9NEOB|nr:unnamed protein product [Ranitomeya imitator]
MAIHHLFQESETDKTGLQSILHQFRERFWFRTLFFFRTTSRPRPQRKTRRGQRTWTRTTQDGNQVSGTDITNNIVYNISSHSFQPPHIYHPVKTYIELVKNYARKVLESIERGNHHVRHNLTVEEKRALSTLKDNKQIIIKPADKGGSIVVLDRDYYMHEIRTQLRDVDMYQPIGNNPTFEISREIKYLVAHYTTTGTIDTKLGEFLVKQHLVTSVFYTLPKIHKHPLRPPGRPIVASTESLLSPLAITLEKILSPLVPRIKSYLKGNLSPEFGGTGFGETTDKLSVSLYGCEQLVHEYKTPGGIESVMSFLSSHTNFSSQQHKFCKDLLTLFFIQRKGTAMGSNMAPLYANIFMYRFELSYVYTHLSFISYVIFWRRYIDDVFLIWTGDVETLSNFHRDLNSSLPGLTFSLSHDPVSMNFLVTRVIINEFREVETDLFVKSTDRNSLLKYDSCHPHHIKRALPKSHHDRVDRIVSNPEVSYIRHQEINEKFHVRGYPDHVLTSSRDTTRLDCPCGLGYVGETTQQIRDRISKHKSTIRAAGPRKDAVAQIQHWNIDKEQGRQTQVELNSKAANELTKTPEGGSPETAIPLVTTEICCNLSTTESTPGQSEDSTCPEEKRGWNPELQKNGETKVAELARLLRANSANGKNDTQSSWSAETKHLRYVSKV